jgi:hypothetical protein
MTKAEIRSQIADAISHKASITDLRVSLVSAMHKAQAEEEYWNDRIEDLKAELAAK